MRGVVVPWLLVRSHRTNEADRAVATFGLIHGAYHGTWQWGPLVAELERRGQRSACVNLPIDDPDRGIPDYAASAAQAFEGVDDLVVVGHSLAGRVIPFVAELLPVRGLIFLAAAVQAGVFGPVPSGPSLLIAEADHTVGDDGLIRMSRRPWSGTSTMTCRRAFAPGPAPRSGPRLYGLSGPNASFGSIRNRR